MRKIKLFFAALMFTAATLAGAQTKTVTGTVTDASNGSPVPFAALQIKGTSNGASTNADGKYSIQVPADGVIIFSSIGYKNQEVAVAGRSVINCVLQPDTEMLDETLVVAYGTVTKEAFTGSAAVVKSDDILKNQTTDVARSLEGRVAGVQLTTANGDLNSEASIRIRGISSISAGKEPLIVVDGVPYSGSLNNINTADIESMTVLKDAASNALYGARGANGVIMITTKKAKLGEAVVTLDAKVGWNSKALQSYDYIDNPAVYYEAVYAAKYRYYTDAVDGPGLSAAQAHKTVASTIDGPVADGGLGYSVYTYPEGEYLIGNNGKLNPNATLGRVVNGHLLTPDNWMKEAYRNSLRQEYNVSVSGTTEKASFLASFGYLDNNGIIEGENMKRYTARLKADYQAKKWLRVGGNFAYTNYYYANANGDNSGNIFQAATIVAPIYPLYIRDAEGNIQYDSHGLKMYDYGNGVVTGVSRPVHPNANPLQGVTLDRANSSRNALNGVGFAEIKFLKDFTFTFNAGFGTSDTRSTDLSNAWYGQFATDGGTLQKVHTRFFYLDLQQLLSYNKTIGKNHIDILAGHDYYTTYSTRLSAYKKKLFSMDVNELDGAVIDGQSASSYRTSYNNEGYFLQARYDYDNKIYASASYRRDASSRFHPDHRWGNFWSVGAGWIISKEPWFKASWVDMLKLKASYGSQGNDSIGDYLYVDTYDIVNNDNEVAVIFSSKGNEKITWETNANFNTGVDFELFNGRLTGSVEYFYRLTTDMLFWFPVPSSLGYDGYYDNIGDMRNHGVEISLNGTVIDTRVVKWNLFANGTHYTNKIIRLPEERKTRIVEGYKGFASGNKFVGEGLPLYTFFMPTYAGVDPETGKSTWYKDIKDEAGNVTGREITDKYSDATEYLHSVPTPAIYGGFGTDLTVGPVDLSVTFTYSIGGKTYDSGYAYSMDVPGSAMGYNYHKDVLKGWTATNKDASIPRFQYLDQNVRSASDRFLVDASYLNLQSIQLGYNLPQRFCNTIHLKKLRIYATCDNIWYWSARKGLDPRQSFTGATDQEVSSPIRTLSGGVTITF